MPYSLDFPVNVGSAAPIQSIASAVASVRKEAQAADPAMAKLASQVAVLTSSGLTFSQACAKIAAGATAATPAVNGLGAAVGNIPTAAIPAAASINTVGRALQTNLVPQTLAATAALRGLDGQMSLRSAARFLTTFNTVGGALQTNLVPQTLAATAALRGLDGQMSLRSAARFLTTIQGLGPILQAAFPLFGAMAFAGVLEQMVSKVGELYNAWNPVIRAQERSLELLKLSIPELEKATKRNNELRREERQLQYGTQTVLRDDVQTKTGDIKSAQRTIDEIKARIAIQEGIVTAGIIAPIAARDPTIRYGKGGALTIEQHPAQPGSFDLPAQAAQEKLKPIYAELKTALTEQDSAIRDANAARLKLSKSGLERERERQSKLDAISKETERIQDRSAALSDRAALERFGPIGKIEERRRAMERGYTREESDLADKIALNKLGGPDEVRVPDSAFAAQRAAIQGAKTKDRASISQELGQEAFSIAAQRSGAFNARSDKIRKLEEKDDAQFAKWDDEVKKKREDADREIENIRLGTGREGITRQAGKAQRVAQMALGQNQQGAAVGVGYQVQINLAQQLYALDMARAIKEEDINKRRVDMAKAEADLIKASSDARLDAEMKVLEIRMRQRQEFESVAKGGFQALVSGGGRGITNFAREKGIAIGSTAVGNAAGMLFDQTGGGRLQIPGQGGPGSPNFLGKLLAGTPFGMDPAKAAQSFELTANTSSTAVNTQATIDLTNVMAAIASGGRASPLPGGSGVTTVLGGAPLQVPYDPSPLGTSLSTGLSIAGSGAGVATAIRGGSATQTAMAGLGLASSSRSLLGLHDFSVALPGGTATTASALLGTGVQAGVGALGVVNGLHTGGARGILQAAGGAAALVGAVVALAPALAAAGPIGAAVAGGLMLTSMLMGDPRANRQNLSTKP